MSPILSTAWLTAFETEGAPSGFEALEVYTKLREATSLEVEVTRRGKPVTLKYTIK